jgi:hypothetical protein
MGTTASGLRYPEPTDPVNQGATAMKNLADDATRNGPRTLGAAAAVAVTLTTAWAANTGPVVVAAVPYPRLLLLECAAYASSMSIGTSSMTYCVRRDGAELRRAALIGPLNSGILTVCDVLAANATATYQGFAVMSAGTAGIAADVRQNYLYVTAFGAAGSG